MQVSSALRLSRTTSAGSTRTIMLPLRTSRRTTVSLAANADYETGMSPAPKVTPPRVHPLAFRPKRTSGMQGADHSYDEISLGPELTVMSMDDEIFPSPHFGAEESAAATAKPTTTKAAQPPASPPKKDADHEESNVVPVRVGRPRGPAFRARRTSGMTAAEHSYDEIVLGPELTVMSMDEYVEAPHFGGAEK